MSEMRPVPLDKAYRLLNHGPTVLVSSAHQGRRNVMAAAWNMPLDFDPPKVAVVIDKSTFSRTLIEASGELVLNVPTVAILDQAYAAGSRSGREGDKFDALGLVARPSERVGAPRVDGCSAWLECRLIREPHIEQAYDLFLAQVVAAAADPALFSDGRWHIDDPNGRSLHHVAGGAFLASGAPLRAAD